MTETSEDANTNKCTHSHLVLKTSSRIESNLSGHRSSTVPYPSVAAAAIRIKNLCFFFELRQPQSEQNATCDGSVATEVSAASGCFD